MKILNICLGNYKIDKLGAVILEKEQNFICSLCMEELIREYTIEMINYKGGKKT